MPEADVAVAEPLSHPSSNYFPLSNDIHCSSQTFERDLKSMDSDKIASSDDKSHAATNHFWNELETDEREKFDALIAAMTKLVNGKVADSDYNPGEDLSSNSDEEPISETERDNDKQEKGTVTFKLDC